jgi:hypothetical protein
MLLPQVCCYFISTTKSSSIVLKTSGNRAEVKSLFSCVNGVLMAGMFIVTFKAFGAAGLGVKEA